MCSLCCPKEGPHGQGQTQGTTEVSEQTLNAGNEVAGIPPPHQMIFSGSWDGCCPQEGGTDAVFRCSSTFLFSISFPLLPSLPPPPQPPNLPHPSLPLSRVLKAPDQLHLNACFPGGGSISKEIRKKSVPCRRFILQCEWLRCNWGGGGQDFLKGPC